MLKNNLFPALLAAAMLAFTPSLQAKDKAERTKGKPEVAEVADTGAHAPKEEVKNLSKDEHAKLKAAREKAESDPAYLAAVEKEKAARKAHLDALKADDEKRAIEAKKVLNDAHEESVKARRDAIAKADPEAAKLDERAFAVGKRLRKDKDAKAKEAGDAVEGAKGKGKGLDHAPGQLKKTEGGEATDHAPGRKKKADKHEKHGKDDAK